MRKAVNNMLKTPLTLGGVKVNGKTQRVVRESLITNEEKQAIQKLGAVLSISGTSISVESKTDIDAKAKAKNVTETFKDVAYPKELIKGDGTLNGKPALKAKIDALAEQYGQTILSDKDFSEKYPDADIEAFRVKVGV